MKILITGGNGFIARNLVEQWGDRYAVTAVGRNQLDLMDFGRVESFLKEKRFEMVIHTATYDAVAKFSTKDPTKVLENNLKMFFNLVRCGGYFGKMIYFGSGAEYDREHWVPKMKEDYFDRYVPQDQYGYSKYLMTKYALLSDNIYNLRLFGNFGKYDDWRTRLIPNVCYLAIMGLPVEINQNKYYDFLDVSDLAKITEWLVNSNPKERVFNVCTGTTIDFKSIAEMVMEFSGKKEEVKVANLGLGMEYSGDNSRLLREMGGFEFKPIKESLHHLYNWYEQNKGEIFK